MVWSAILALMVLISPLASPAHADVVTISGDATGSGPWVLSSPTGFSSYGEIDVALTTPIPLSSLANFSAVFTDILGGVGNGSPRFQLTATNGDFFSIYLGPPAFNFSDPNPVTFTAAFSGQNLDNATKDTGFQNLFPSGTFASFFLTFGTDMVDEFSFIVGNGGNAPQSLTVGSLTLNDTTYGVSAPVAAVPEPSSLLLLMPGLIGFAFLRRHSGRINYEGSAA